MEQLTIKVPNHPAMLKAVGEALLEMSDCKCTKQMEGRALRPEPEVDVTIEQLDPVKLFGNKEEVVDMGTVDAPELTDHSEAPAPSGVELDKDGVPWDERIHSSNGKMTAKGVWQRRRGVDDITFANVMQELKQGQAAAASGPAIPPPPSTEGGATTFEDVCAYITDHAVPYDRAEEVARSLGLPNFPALKQTPNLVASFMEGIK